MSYFISFYVFVTIILYNFCHFSLQTLTMAESPSSACVLSEKFLIKEEKVFPMRFTCTYITFKCLMKGSNFTFYRFHRTDLDIPPGVESLIYTIMFVLRNYLDHKYDIRADTTVSTSMTVNPPPCASLVDFCHDEWSNQLSAVFVDLTLTSRLTQELSRREHFRRQ